MFDLRRLDCMQLKGFLANGTVFHFGRTTGALDDVEGGKDKDKNAQRIKEFFETCKAPVAVVESGRVPSLVHQAH